MGQGHATRGSFKEADSIPKILPFHRLASETEKMTKNKTGSPLVRQSVVQFHMTFLCQLCDRARHKRVRHKRVRICQSYGAYGINYTAERLS